MSLVQAHQIPYSFKYDFDVNGGLPGLIPMGVMIPHDVIVNYTMVSVTTALATSGATNFISIGTTNTPLSFFDPVTIDNFSTGAILVGKDLIRAMIEPGFNQELVMQIAFPVLTAGVFIFTAICTVHQ